MDGRRRDTFARAMALRSFEGLVLELGGDPAAIMAAARLEADAASNPSGLISYRAFIRLRDHAAAMLSCPDFGMRLAARQGPPDSVGIVSMMMRHAPSIRDALVNCTRYLQSLSPHADVRLEKGENDTVLRCDFDRTSETEGLQLVEHHVQRWNICILALSEKELKPTGVSLLHQPLYDRAQYEAYFGAPVRFGQAYNALHFERGVLHHVVRDRDEVLYALAKQFSAQHFPPTGNAITSQVRWLISQRASPRITCTQIAAQLNVSNRVLQSRLSEEQQSFGRIKDEVLRDAAARYLADHNLRLNEVAELIGLSGPALSRRCTRWFGMSPRAVRSAGRPGAA